MAPPARRLFRPTARQLIVVAPLGVLALGYAFYMRYGVIQDTPTGLACDNGLATLLCQMRSAAIALYQHSMFGAVAVGVALVNLLRPALVLLLLGMIAAALGIVLYNIVLSGLAVALLILSLARPAPGAK
ncbi:MAG TPA: hypothetical protein VGZ49_11260 [Xanthobacteraceae bacterium]|jgi:hypothetical protein|nr:hypothetical protein [Xanthobacteraceae bacterium]